MKASQLKDMPVVSMADGTKIGNVQDALFDTTTLKLSTLVLSGAGGKSLLPFGSVRSFGADVITVESAAVTQGIEGQGAVGSLRSLRELVNLRVINGEGTHLGDVKDLEVNDQDGQVTEVAAHRGGLLGMGGASVAVPASAVRGVGPKIITVDMPATGTVAPPAASPPPSSPTERPS